MQAFFGITFKNRYFFAAYDGAGVYFGSDEMDGAAGYFYAGVESLLDGMEAAKDGDGSAVAGGVGAADAIVGQEGGVNVDDAARELGEEGGAENAHPAGQHEQINLEELQPGGQFGLAFLAVVPGQVHSLQVMLMSAFQAVGVYVVADDQYDFNAGEFVALDGIDQGLEVAAGTGDQDSQAQSGLF